MKKPEEESKIPMNFEEVPDQEATWREEISVISAQLQEIRKLKHPSKEILRGVHPKSHGCVDAAFIVNKDIGENHQVGLFADPGRRYDAKIRYSNASVLVRPDLEEKKNGSRGMAIKVCNVCGPVLLEDCGARNQDFLMVNTPEFAFANVRDYRRLSRALLSDQDGAKADLYFLPLELLKLGILEPSGKLKPPTGDEPPQVLGMRQIFEHSPVFEGFSPEDIGGTLSSFGVVQKILQAPVRNPLQVQYFSAAPYRYGLEQAMKFSVTPIGGPLPQPDFTAEEAASIDENYLAQALRDILDKNNEIRLSFKVQVVTASQVKDRRKEMIETATTIWSEDEFPFVEVAQIVIEAAVQNLQLVDACKPLLFTPWHALAAHEPLGGINRLRKPVYSKSADTRRNAAKAY